MEDSDDLFFSRSRNNETDSSFNPRMASFINPSTLFQARGSFNTSHKFYKTQSQCFICSTIFSKYTEPITKRHCCQFCYNAVCHNCSPLTFPSSVSSKEERICLICYKVQLKADCERELELTYRKTLDSETEVRLTESVARKMLESKCEVLEKELSSKDEYWKGELEKELRFKDEYWKGEMEKVKSEMQNEREEEVERVKGQLENKLVVERENGKRVKGELEVARGVKDQRAEVRGLREENEALKKRVEGLMRETKASSCGCCAF